MSTPHTMAQPPPQPHQQQQQQRPRFSPPPQIQQHDYSMTNGRSSSFTGTSNQMPMVYPSTSPQQYSPQFAQAPPPKRQRLSPDAQSPISNPSYPRTATQQAFSPTAMAGAEGNITNGASPATTRPGLMAPPQRPPEKAGHDQSYNDILTDTGVDLEEEARSLSRPDYYTQSSTSFQSGSNSFGSYQANSFGQPNGITATSFESGSQSQATSVDPEEKIKREQQRADWEAARHSQHALWDMFLYGGNLNERIKKFSSEEHLTEAQAGVLVNTQRNAPPPKVRVNGLEGATRVIDQGQSILDTKDKADRLSDIMKLISLAARTRMTALISASTKLAYARRAHCKGIVPDDWTDIAITLKEGQESTQAMSSSAGDTNLKRSYSQMDGEPVSSKPSVAAQAFDKAAQTARSAEEARLAKRAKRTAKLNASKDSEADAELAEAAALDAEKKTTKKERKAQESKFTEQQQHKNANDAARMATSGLMGRTLGKKGKSYSWMTGGGAGGGPGGSSASTPGRVVGSASGTPSGAGSFADRGPAVPKGRQFRDFDEDKDSKLQARDVLLVLESDALAARSYVKGYNIVDGKDP